MIKKGKHFLFGCALVFAIGASTNVASAETIVSDATTDQTQQVTETSESASSENVTLTTAVSEEATSTTATSEVASETVASSETASTTSEVATSETSTAASSEVASSEASTSATEVVASEISSTTSATSVANRTAYIGYEVQYTTSTGEVVGKTANIVAADTTEAVATATLTVAATDVPAGYELAAEQTYSLTQQISENQINILSFAVVKKSEEEEIAASQLENKTPLLQAIAEAEALTSEATRLLATSQQGNQSLTAATEATKVVTTEATTVLKDPSATEEQVQATTATVQESSVSLGEELAKLNTEGIVTAQLSSVTGSAAVTELYNITWDNQIVQVFDDEGRGRSDAGFELKTDANGKRILVYKYNLNDPIPFTMDDVLKQLNAIPKDANAGIRTLDGSEKAKIQASTDGYGTAGNSAQLNGQTIDFLDIVNPVKLWGGQQVVGPASPAHFDSNYTTLYVPGTTDKGTKSHQTTVGGTHGTSAVTLDGTNTFDFYSNQVDRQKLYIRSSEAAYEGAGSAVATDTDTDYIPVYMVGYEDTTRPTVTANTTTGTQLNASSPVSEYLFVFGTTEGTTETETGATNAAPVVNKANASATFATMSDPEGDALTISYDDANKSMTSLGSNLTLGTDGKIEGSFAHTAGGSYTRRVNVTDPSGDKGTSAPFYVYGYTDKEIDTTEIVKNEGVAVTDAEIFAKLGIATTSTAFPVNGNGQTVPTVPDSEYTRTVVGYRPVGSTTVTDATTATLPTTGDYEVKVRTRNIYGQDIYNWVTVNYNEAPDLTEVGTDTNTTVYQNGTVDHYIFVFGKTEGTTEATNAAGQTAAGNAPVIDKANATKTVVSVSDPENNNPVTITYDNNAAEPRVETTLGSNLTVGTDGKLEGYFDHEAGGFHSRRIVATDSLGAKSTSNPFMTYAYTDKEVDTTPVTKTAVGQAVTNEEIFAKLGIVTSSTQFPNNTAAHDVIPTVPTNEYTREVVGYRAVGGTDVTNATTATLPTSGTYEVKVRTRNIYGQDIYNWVTVEYPANTPTTATDKQPLYVFNNTAIKTVDPGTNVDTSTTDDKVNVVTLQDPEGIQSVAVTRETDVNTAVFNPANIGITIDADGNASGTPSVGAIGVYSRGLTVTDGTGDTTDLFPRDNEMQTYVLDATAGETITKAIGESVTEAEILDNVTVATGNSNTMDAAIDTRYRKVLAPDQTLPTTEGTHTVMVRVITESNVYKDVPVTVIIDTTAPEAPVVTAKPDGSVTVKPSTTAGDDTTTVDITYTDETGVEKTVTATKADDGTWSVPADSGVTVDPTTGVVTIPADKVQEGSTVSAVSKDEAGNTSSPATDTVDTTAPEAPTIETDLTGKAGTTDPVTVTGAEPGSTVTLKDKDGNVIGTGTADENGVVTITPATPLPEGPVTATSTDEAGNESEASEPKVATTPDTTAPVAPTIETDLTGKAGTTDPVTVTGAEPGSTVTLKDK
ncbi:Ig-like domain-containing protein, partial [Streptococcus suis]|nr:Ig-like domain-containing protein [Streptococcus suis]